MSITLWYTWKCWHCLWKCSHSLQDWQASFAPECTCFHMLSVVFACSATDPSDVTAGIILYHTVCALFGPRTDPVFWHQCDILSRWCCTALAASCMSLDVLLVSPSPDSASTLLGPLWLRSTRPLVKNWQEWWSLWLAHCMLTRSRTPVFKLHNHCSLHEHSCNPLGQCQEDYVIYSMNRSISSLNRTLL